VSRRWSWRDGDLLPFFVPCLIAAQEEEDKRTTEKKKQGKDG